MRTEITPKGWNEIEIKTYVVTGVSKRPLMTVKNWLESSKRLGLSRSKCQRCLNKLSNKPEEDVFLIFTDKGNRFVCKSCYEELKGRFFETA